MRDTEKEGKERGRRREREEVKVRMKKLFPESMQLNFAR